MKDAESLRLITFIYFLFIIAEKDSLNVKKIYLRKNVIPLSKIDKIRNEYFNRKKEIQL